MSDWGSRARIKELEKQVKDTENRFQLMLQEREFFAKQIRDIRGIFRAWATVQRGDERFAEAMNTVLDRPNPMGS